MTDFATRSLAACAALFLAFSSIATITTVPPAQAQAAPVAALSAEIA